MRNNLGVKDLITNLFFLAGKGQEPLGAAVLDVDP